MNVLEILKERWEGLNYPFLIDSSNQLFFNDILKERFVDLSDIKSGDVVALIGNYDAQSILTLLRLIDKNVIIVPLTKETKPQHESFFKSSLVNIIIEDSFVKHIKHNKKNKLIELLKYNNHAGLILFSTGTSGPPKAILHDLTLFMKKFETKRPSLKTISFLLFDHIGGLNTLLHTLFNKGTLVTVKSRSVENVLKICSENDIEVLPTTPTFLRMMLISGLIPLKVPKSLRIITYGTERMDQTTLDKLCELLPNIDFRQTYGMSEIGIVRVKSKSRNSLFMKVGGEGIETRVVDNVLEIRSQTKMVGYLNADSPFYDNGWYNTKDIVEESEGHLKITGRISELINVGGLKFMVSEVENAALQFEGVEFAKADGKTNPITGQHVELTVQLEANKHIDKAQLKVFLRSVLPAHMLPRRIKFSSVIIGHRFKRA